MLLLSGDGVRLVDSAGVETLVVRAVLRRGDRLAGHAALHRTDLPDWRLVPEQPISGAWLRNLPDVGALSARVRHWSTWAALASIAVLAGLWGFGGTLLAVAAPLLSHRMVVRLGDSMVRELGGNSCTAPAGTAALGRLSAADPGQRLRRTRRGNRARHPRGQCVRGSWRARRAIPWADRQGAAPRRSRGRSDAPVHPRCAPPPGTGAAAPRRSIAASHGDRRRCGRFRRSCNAAAPLAPCRSSRRRRRRRATPHRAYLARWTRGVLDPRARRICR